MLVDLIEFPLTLKVMLGVLIVEVIFTVILDLAGLTFLEPLLISVLVLITMFGLLTPVITFIT